MTTFWIAVACAVAGYVAAIFTWDLIHTSIVGLAAKADQLRQRARDLEQRLRDAAGI